MAASQQEGPEFESWLGSCLSAVGLGLQNHLCQVDSPISVFDQGT